MSPERCLGEHSGAPWILREPLKVPGDQIDGPLKASGDHFWVNFDPQRSFNKLFFVNFKVKLLY